MNICLFTVDTRNVILANRKYLPYQARHGSLKVEAKCFVFFKKNFNYFRGASAIIIL